MLTNKPEQFVQHKWCSTCLKNNLFAPNTCSLQVNEGSHLLGPRMLSNETVAGLQERDGNKKERLKSYSGKKNVTEI